MSEALSSSQPSITAAHQVLFNLELFENILVQAPRGTQEWQGIDGKLIFNPEGAESMRTILRLQRVCKFFSTVIRHSRSIQRRLFRLPGPVKEYVCNCGINDKVCTTELNPLLANLLNTDEQSRLEFRCVARVEGRRLRRHWDRYYTLQSSLFEDSSSSDNNANAIASVFGRRNNVSDLIENASWSQDPDLISRLPILRFGVHGSSRFLNLYSNISRREEIKKDGSRCTYVEHEPRNQTWETMYFTYPPVCAESSTLFSLVNLVVAGSGNMTVCEGLQAADIQHSAGNDFYQHDSAKVKFFSLSQWLETKDDEACKEWALWSSRIERAEEEEEVQA